MVLSSFDWVRSQNQEGIDALYKQGNDPQFILIDNRFVDCNDAALSLFKYSSKNFFRELHPSEVSPDYQPDGQLSYIKAEQMMELCNRDGQHTFNWVHQDKDAQLHWAKVTLEKVQLSQISVVHANVAILNSGVELLQQDDEHAHDSVANASYTALDNYVLLNQYKRAIDQSSIVSKTDVKGNITYVNDKFSQVSGYSKQQLIGQPHSIISHPNTPKSLFKDLWSTIKSGNVWHGIIQNRKQNGESYYVDSYICPIMNAKGKITEYIAIRNDITAMYQQEKLIVYQNTDGTTGLQNKTKLGQDLSENKLGHLAIIRLKELDQFEHVFSPEINQKILHSVTHLIVEHFNQLETQVTVYKVSSRDFVVLCDHELAEEGFKYQLESLVNMLMMLELKVEGFDIPLTVSAGWVENAQEGNKFNNALLALRGIVKNNTLVAKFNPNNNLMLNRIEQTMSWTVKLKNALADGDICIFGQKLFDANGDTYSTEVLMRYYDSGSERYVSPFVFLDFAKKSKLYNQLSKFVTNMAFQHFSALNQRFSINTTLIDLTDANYRDLLINLLVQYDIGNKLTLELVETEAFKDDTAEVHEFLTELKTFGVKIAIDDFGSGYSNFNYFTLLPVDIVKIDGSLIKDIDSNEKHFLLVKSIVEFCQQMNIQVVAEFVENEVIFNKLKCLKIDYFQGYFFHQPEKLQ